MFFSFLQVGSRVATVSVRDHDSDNVTFTIEAGGASRFRRPGGGGFGAGHRDGSGFFRIERTRGGGNRAVVKLDRALTELNVSQKT